MNTYQQPDASGHFGIYGGTFASETLTHAIKELRDAYARYKDDPEFQAWVAWMQKYFPSGSLEDPQNVVGYVQAQTMVQVLKQCGDNLTRENVMKQAANLKNFHPAMLLKGINMTTSPTDYQPMEEMLLQRFNGERFEVFGDLLSARVNK